MAGGNENTTHTQIYELTYHKIANITRHKVGYASVVVCVLGVVAFSWGILGAVRGVLVNMQRTSKLNQTAKLSVSGWRDLCMKMVSLEGIKASAAPLSLGFSGIGSTLCREVANFACKFQSMSSKHSVPGYFRGSDRTFPLLSASLYHSCSPSSFGS